MIFEAPRLQVHSTVYGVWYGHRRPTDVDDELFLCTVWYGK